MVSAAKRDCEFIADLAAEGPALRKSNMMGVRRLPTADQTWLPCDKFDVIPVADSSRLRQAERAFVDRLAWRSYLRATPVRCACGSREHRTCIGLRPCSFETLQLCPKGFLHKLGVSGRQSTFLSKVSVSPQRGVIAGIQFV